LPFSEGSLLVRVVRSGQGGAGRAAGRSLAAIGRAAAALAGQHGPLCPLCL